MLFDKEIQQDVIEPEDKRNKENVPEDVIELSSEKAEIKGEQIEEEEKEKEECVSKESQKCLLLCNKIFITKKL